MNRHDPTTPDRYSWHNDLLVAGHRAGVHAETIEIAPQHAIEAVFARTATKTEHTQPFHLITW